MDEAREISTNLDEIREQLKRIADALEWLQRNELRKAEIEETRTERSARRDTDQQRAYAARWNNSGR